MDIIVCAAARDRIYEAQKETTLFWLDSNVVPSLACESYETCEEFVTEWKDVFFGDSTGIHGLDKWAALWDDQLGTP